MQEAVKRDYMTEEQYLEMEETSAVKHEYYQGEIFAMAGASFEHNIIVSNIIGELRGQLRKKPCRVFPGDMKVRIEKIKKYSYPDFMVVCGETNFFGDKRNV